MVRESTDLLGLWVICFHFCSGKSFLEFLLALFPLLLPRDLFALYFVFDRGRFEAISGHSRWRSKGGLARITSFLNSATRDADDTSLASGGSHREDTQLTSLLSLFQCFTQGQLTTIVTSISTMLIFESHLVKRLFLGLIFLIPFTNALHFYLDASERRCFIEELPTDTVVEGTSAPWKWVCLSQWYLNRPLSCSGME